MTLLSCDNSIPYLVIGKQHFPKESHRRRLIPAADICASHQVKLHLIISLKKLINNTIAFRTPILDVSDVFLESLIHFQRRKSSRGVGAEPSHREKCGSNLCCKQ